MVQDQDLEDQVTNDLVRQKRRYLDVSPDVPMDERDMPIHPKTAAPPPPPPPDYTRLAGYSTSKVGDAANMKAKEQIGRTLVGFDPKSGVSPEVLAALNKLGFGTFSGSGQNLGMSGLTDAGRAAGLGDNFDPRDWVINYTGEGPAQWGYDPFVQQQTAGGSTGTASTAGAAARGGSSQASFGTGSTQSGIAGPLGSASFSSYPGSTGATSWTSAQEAAAGIKDLGNNLVQLPNGMTVDRNNNWYTQTMQQTGGGAGGGSGSGGTDTSLEGMLQKLLQDEAARKSANDDFNTKIHSSILQGIDENSKPVADDDPIIAGQMRARQGEADKAMAAGREALAARAGASGMPTGAFDASLQSSYENLGSDMGAAHAGLMADRYKEKLNQLMQLRQTGAGVMSADEQASLNAQITAIKARLDDLNLKSQSQIGNRELDIRDANQKAQLNQDNSHFYDTLGFNIGDREAALNALIMRILSGGA